MGIEIKISDLSNIPASELQPLLRFLQGFLQIPGIPAVIPRDDLPSTGVEVITPQQAFDPAGSVAAAAAFGAARQTPDAAPQLPANPQHIPPIGADTPYPYPTVEQRQATGQLPPPGAPAVGEQDVKGVIWDPRIHSSNKSKNADQTWKAKRGVDAVLVTQVLAAQKGEGSWPFPNTAAQLGMAASGAGFPPSNAPAAPSPTPVFNPAAAAAAPSASPSSGGSYIDLVTRVQTFLLGGHVTVPEVTQCCMAGGCADLPTLAGMPANVAIVAAQFDALLRGKGFA